MELNKIFEVLINYINFPTHKRKIKILVIKIIAYILN